MTALDRKALRDLAQARGQMTAVAMIIACGVATFVLSLCTLRTLERARAEFYERCRFAEVFTHVKRAPRSLEERLGRVWGVGRVQTRIVAEATLNVADLPEPATCRLVSLPPGPGPHLNDLYLRSGRRVDPGRRGEAMVAEAFAEAHGLRPGDSVSAVLNGRSQSLHVVGIVLSPEYVFQVRPGEMLPDVKRYGIFWMRYEDLAAAFDMDGAFNDVALTLVRGADEQRVIAAIDDVTAAYGGSGAFGRAEHPSDRYISDELRQLRAMGLVMPAVFLAVAAFLLNVVLSRLVQTQREQIAALKAFGYSRGRITAHYLKFAAPVVVGGAALGVVAGARIGRGLAGDYTRFYRFPDFEFSLSGAVVAAAVAVSVLAGAAAVLGAVRRAARLPAAEAMRPEPPAVYRPLVAERLGLHGLLTPAARMVLRNLERRPLRACTSILGVAMAVSTLVVGLFSADVFDFVTEFQFFTAQRQDMTVAFVEPTSGRVAHDLAHLPGVRACETFRSIPARIRFGHRSRRTAVMGLPPVRRFYRLLDRGRREVPLPRDGLVVSAKLAEVLGCRPGDTVVLEVLEGDRRVRRVTLSAVADEFSGTNAYMSASATGAMMREGDAVSGAMLAVDPRRAGELYRVLKRSPRVASVQIKTASLRSFTETLAENIRKMRMFNIAFATIIAVGVVYNAARISLSEHSRELASLRVLGFTRREVSAILLGELAVLTLAAVPLGLALGFVQAGWIISVFSTETLTLPAVVYPRTYGVAMVVTLSAAAACALYVRRRLDHLDLVSVLKSRE